MASNNFMISVETPTFMIWISDQSGDTSLLGTEPSPSTIAGTVEIDTGEDALVSSASFPGAAVALADHAILFSWSFALKKVISPNSGSDLYASSRIQGTPLQVMIANGTFVASLEQSFVTGQTLAVISIIKLANLPINTQDPKDPQLPTVTEQNIFEGCFILGLEPKYDARTNMDMVKMDIRYSKRTHTIFKYNQQGDLLGQNASVYDFTSNTSSTTEFDDTNAQEVYTPSKK